MNASSIITAELQQAAQVLNNFLSTEENLTAIEKAVAFFVTALKAESKIISCGNGGSACDAMHFAEELTGRFRDNRAPIAAISISDAGHITCTANDYGYDQVFSRYVQALGRKGDVLLAISTSGNSENVLKAAEAAKAAGMKVVSLTGKDGGKLAKISDVNVNVAHQGYADRVQEVHIKIIHIFILLIEEQLRK